MIEAVSYLCTSWKIVPLLLFKYIQTPNKSTACGTKARLSGDHHSKFAVDTFNDFWVVCYIKFFALVFTFIFSCYIFVERDELQMNDVVELYTSYANAYELQCKIKSVYSEHFSLNEEMTKNIIKYIIKW